MKIEVTQSTFKSVANRLVARLNAMGLVTKTGKPLVVDQGYEAVAAILGFRNQHAFRGKLPDVAAAEHQAESEWARIVNAHGWNDESQIIHLEGFLADQGLMAQFVEYARAVAAEESEDELPTWNASETAYALLEKLGYAVQLSDLKGWYWQLQDNASEDYVTEDEAYAAAYRHAFAENDFDAVRAAEPILTEQGYTLCEDSDLPGMFCWFTDSDACETSFTIREVAVLDAWTHFQANQA